jgi:hypothetical protein
MMTALAMKREFQLNHLSQTLEHLRLGQEELRRLSHQVLAAQETRAGDTPKE